MRSKNRRPQRSGSSVILNPPPHRTESGSPYRCTIDHFHYDVTCAKVSGSCNKDRAQCRAIAGKCQKISISAMSAKASYQVFHKVTCPIAIQIQRNSAWRFFFSINEELRRVLLTNISMENFFPNSEHRVCGRKKCFNIVLI